MDSVDVPLISEEKKKGLSPLFIALIVVGSVVVVGAIVAVVLVLVLGGDTPTTDYGVIIDAGSSGSRVYVYEWPHRKDNKTVPVVAPLTPNGLEMLHIRQLRSVGDDLPNTVEPGIAKIDPANISEYLKPLLDYANSLVPDNDKPRTPIFLFATAGMRLVSNETQTAIINAVRSTLQTTKFNFTYQDDWARVISGAEEGVFGWVTANYLKSILFENDAKNHVVGALDLGGASLQITFLPEERPVENEMVLTLPNNVFELYTYSFLRYGQDQTMKGVINAVVEDLKEKTGSIPDDIPFPCYLQHYNETVVIEDKNHTLYGTGDFESCSDYEKVFMNVTGACAVPPCSMDGVYQPNVTGDFYAMSGFYYTASFFGFASETEKVQPVKFKEYGTDFCSKTWEKAVEEHPSLKPAYLKVYCLTSSYIYNILTAGFRFDENDTNIYFTSTVNGTTLNWALGGLIAEASLLPK